MTREEFAQSIKTKYPVYKDMGNDELVNKILAKYPVYKDQISDNPSMLSSFGRGVGQGATLGYAEEASAMLPKIRVNPINQVNMINPQEKQQVEQNYVTQRDISRQKDLAAQQAHPYAYGAGQVVGSIPTSLGLGRLGVPLPVQGAIAGLGSSEADLTKGEIGKAAIDTGIGTAIGTIPVIAGKFLDTAKPLATSMARRSLGYVKSLLKTKESQLKANDVANTMLKEGAIPFGAGSEKIMSKLDDLTNSTGSDLTQIRATLHNDNQLAFNPKDVAKEIEKQLSPKYSGGEYETKKNMVKNIKDTVMAHASGSGKTNFNSAGDMLDMLAESAKFKMGSPTNGDPIKAKMFRRAYGIASDMLDDSVKKGLDKTGKSELLQEYLKNKELYSKALDAFNAVSGLRGGEMGNMAVSARSLLAGGAELAATGNPARAAMAAGGMELFKRRGPSMLANTANLISKTPQSVRNIGTGATIGSIPLIDLRRRVSGNK